MTRSAVRRASAVQVEKSLPPTAPVSSSGAARETSRASAIPWSWRLALFMWGISFACLLLYEWLAGIIKAW